MSGCRQACRAWADLTHRSSRRQVPAKGHLLRKWQERQRIDGPVVLRPLAGTALGSETPPAACATRGVPKEDRYAVTWLRAVTRGMASVARPATAPRARSTADTTGSTVRPRAASMLT